LLPSAGVEPQELGDAPDRRLQEADEELEDEHRSRPVPVCGDGKTTG